MSGVPSVTIPGRRLIPILALLASFGPLATDMYLSAFPEMQRDLRSDAGGVAATFSVFLLGLSLGQLVYGPLSDRYGRRRPLLAGTALFCVASALILFSNDITSFTLLRIAQALGGCCGIIIGRAVVRDLYDESGMANAFSALSMIGMAAPLIAPSLGVAVILLAGWRAVFAVLVVFGIVAFAAIWFGLPETLAPERRRTRLTIGSVAGGFGRLLAQRSFVLAALTTGSAAGALFSFITSSSLVFMDHYRLGRVEYGVVFSGVVLAMIAGGQVNRRLLRRHAPADLLRWSLPATLAATVLMLGGAMAGMPLLVIALLLAVFAIGSTLPNSAASAIGAAREDAGSAASLLGVIQFGSGFLASSAVALAQNGTPWPMALSMAGCSVIGCLSWWFSHSAGSSIAPNKIG